MWTPKSLKVNRFMSHLSTEYVFNHGVATMIYGENRDDDAQESNGSGKSVLIEGIAMSLVGSPLRDARPVELIMDGEDSCEVETTWFNTRSQKEMKIWRKVPSRGSSIVKVYIDGQDQSHNIPTVRDADNFILEQLDIAKEDLFNYFIISKEKYQSFFSFGDVKKKEVVARFSNANIVEPVFDVVKGDLKTLETTWMELDRKRYGLNGKIETLDQQISADGPDQETEKREQIEKLQKRISDGKVTIEDEKASLLQLTTKLQENEEKLANFKEIDYKEKLNLNKQQLADHNTRLKSLKTERKECDDFVHELEHIIAGTIQCPSCKFKFILNSDINAEEAAEMLPQAKEALKEVIDTITDTQTSIQKCEELDRELTTKQRSQQNQRSELEFAVTTVKRQKTQAEQNVTHYTDAIEKFKAQIEEVESRPIVDVKAPLIKEKKVAETALKSLEKEIKDIEQQKAEVAEWEYKFKRFKSFLANKAIESIEAYTTYYLQQIKTNLGLKLSGYKVKADGTLSEKITATVMRNGLEVATFGRFSGGEKVRIEICNIVALQQLINLNSNSGGLDLLFLDEIIESVDGKGVTELMKALNLLNKTVLVITHTNHAGVYDHVVTVVKQDGFSKIVN